MERNRTGDEEIQDDVYNTSHAEGIERAVMATPARVGISTRAGSNGIQSIAVQLQDNKRLLATTEHSSGEHSHKTSYYFPLTRPSVAESCSPEKLVKTKQKKRPRILKGSLENR